MLERAALALAHHDGHLGDAQPCSARDRERLGLGEIVRIRLVEQAQRAAAVEAKPRRRIADAQPRSTRKMTFSHQLPSRRRGVERKLLSSR